MACVTQTVYRAIVVDKLLYAWWGFTTAADRQRIERFLRRGVRVAYRQVDEPTASQLVEDSDDQLFHRVQHVTFCSHFFAITALTLIVLRHRRHDFVLPCRLKSLTDSNIIITQLLKTLFMLFSTIQCI